MLHLATEGRSGGSYRRDGGRSGGSRSARSSNTTSEDDERVIGQERLAIPPQIPFGRQTPVRRLTQPIVDRVVGAISPPGSPRAASKGNELSGNGADGAMSWSSSRSGSRPQSISGSRHGTGAQVNTTTESPSIQLDDPDWSGQHKAKHEGGIKRNAFSENYFQKFFIVERELGKGGKGVVLLVRHELDGVNLGHFACKRVPVGDDHAWLEKVLIEVQLLQQLSHPNLVSYRHVWLENSQLSRFGPSVPCAYILQQYCNSGDLLRYVVGDVPKLNTNEQLKAQMRRRSKGAGGTDKPDMSAQAARRLPFEEIYSFFRDITAGLAHLHSANYIHRDLKPSNCLLHRSDSGSMRCLISDFGEVQASSAARAATGATGTISYCAPEVLKPDENGRYQNFTAKSDVFSLGMILYFMCFRRLPYVASENITEEFEDLEVLREEISGWRGFSEGEREREDLPEQVYRFLRRLLSVNPDDRPTAQEILHVLGDNEELGFSRPINIHKRDKSSSRRISPLPSGEGLRPALSANGGSRTSSAAYMEDDAGHITSTASPFRSLSPKKRPLSPRSQEPNPTNTIVRQSISVPEKLEVAPPPPLATPLLMPPPPVHHPLHYQLLHPVHTYEVLAPRTQQIVASSIRLSVFLLKAYTLISPCLPWATNNYVALPLLVLMGWEASGEGAVTVGSQGRAERRVLGLVLGLATHFVVLWVAARTGRLCAGGSVARGVGVWDAAWEGVGGRLP